MARIKEYTNTQTFDPSPMGQAARAQEASGYYAGQSLKSGMNQISAGIKEVEEHVAQNEMSKMAADLATAHAELQTEWDDAVKTADPNDHEMASRFMQERIKPRMDKIGSGLLTSQAQNMFTRSSAGVSAELFTRTHADQAHLAGEAAISNLDVVKNQLSNVARSNPGGLKNVLGLADMSIDGLVAQFGLPREKALELRNSVRGEIAKSAAYGAADMNPDQAKKDLESGVYNDYIDGTTVKTLSNYADSRIRAQAEQARAAAVEQRRVEDAAAEDIATQISTSIIDPESGVERLPPDYFLNITKYGQMPGAKHGTVESLRSAGERMLKTPVLVSDVDTRNNFMSRIWLQNDDPNKLSLPDVDAAFGTGLLSKADHTMMRTSILDAGKDPNKAENMRQFARVMGSFKSFISKSSMLVSDKDGDQRYGQFQQEKAIQFQNGLSAGLTAKEMLDPRDKSYIFSDVQRYQPSADITRFQQGITGNITPVAPPPLVPWASAPSYVKPQPGQVPSSIPKRLEGESASDFLKRAQ